MTAVGFAWFLAGADRGQRPGDLHVGAYFGPLYLALVVHMLLAFPGGRLETTAQRALVIAGYLRAARGRAAVLPAGRDVSSDPDAPRRTRFALADEPDVGRGLRRSPARWAPWPRARGGPPAGAQAPRGLAPSAARWRRCCGPALVLAACSALAAPAAGRWPTAASPTSSSVVAARWRFAVAALRVPGRAAAQPLHARGRRRRAHRAPRTRASGGGSLRDALADALGDPRCSSSTGARAQAATSTPPASRSSCRAGLAAAR